ncbi:ABC transporter substrate-binding protein [Paenibacillus mucilaginosus]|uniref:Extracellular solute-binding protein family 1 n=1 Tax=Paenibacillus mucilaginosus (strain KNP414) TaxID=1036673 RepID=F8F9B9_PAEMK|nr:extracellular solute-binding protein [Paenibacillus mucilaginosus]AEI43047.1 extracellular solute-binding protein family 1 [Paenibacillus mucilaginosus KNP414]MCG7215986.1 extracellular solute-binding protein [Paenibacillus mucilaginosus]WDM24669.1 extracellular solute-binding protein [Paenibacillus mucilaginosus]
MNKLWLGTALLTALSLSLGACSQGTPEAGETPAPQAAETAAGSTESDDITEPTKLKLFVTGATFTDTEFKVQIKEQVEKRFKNVTIERITPPAGTTVQDFFSSGEEPDLIFGDGYHALKQLKVVEDLRPFIKKYNFDESRLKPHTYDYIKDFGENGEIYGIPYNSNQHILYYNKDVFDKFGVAYPSDEQMTWDQAFELGRQLTREEGGVQYIGIDTEGLGMLSRSYALPILDPKTGKSVLNSPQWLTVFQAAKTNFEIPGFLPKDETKYMWGRDVFMKDRTMAMRPAWLANMVGPLEELRQQGIESNWDIAPVPTFPDQLGKTREAQVHSITLSSLSKNKDAAFKVIKFLLSDEAQRVISRNARVPAVINPELEKEYGADVGVLKGKKIENIFKYAPLKTHASHKYESSITKFVTEANLELARGADVNTVIRKTSETIDKEVEKLLKNE